MADEPTLTPEKREGFLSEFGMSPTQPYEIGAGDEAVAAEEAPETQEAAEETPVQPEVAAEPEPTTAVEEPVAAAEAAPESETPAEEPSDIDYLNSLMAKPAETPAPAAAGGLSLEQVQQLLELSKGKIETARDTPPETPGEAIDLGAMDWTADAVQVQLQERLRAADQDPALAGVLGGLLNDFSQVIDKNVVKPGLGGIEARFKEKEARATQEEQIRTSWANLGNVPALIQERFPGTMEADVASQFANGLREVLAAEGDSMEARGRGLSNSLLGQHILKNPQLALTQEGVMEAVLTIAGGARLSKRAGQPQTVMTGTKEEVSGALAKAHGVTETTTKKEEDLTPEERILADMDKAAKESRVSMGANPFFS